MTLFVTVPLAGAEVGHGGLAARASTPRQGRRAGGQVECLRATRLARWGVVAGVVVVRTVEELHQDRARGPTGPPIASTVTLTGECGGAVSDETRLMEPQHHFPHLRMALEPSARFKTPNVRCDMFAVDLACLRVPPYTASMRNSCRSGVLVKEILQCLWS
jgi:hypothetical protein